MPDVGDVEVAGRAIEGEPPGIAQAVSHRLPCGTALQRVDPQQLAELDAQILRAVPGVPGRAAVAHADVEQAVRPELQLAAVVIGVRLLDEEELPGARGDRPAVARSELDHARVAVPIGVVDVEAVVLRIRGTERDGEQPALAAARDARADVEERPGDAPADEVPDAPGLLDDVEPVRLRCRRRDIGRVREAGRVRAHADRRCREHGGRPHEGGDHTAARSSSRTQGPGGVNSCSTWR